MSAGDQKQHIPGFRNIVHDIEEAGGPLFLLHEIVDEHGLERLIEVLDLGLVIYQAGNILFVPIGDFRIYDEMTHRIANDEGDDDDAEEDASDTEPLKAGAG